MAASCYPEAISRVLKSEGGYVNHPSDPGGETNYGITIAVARANGYQGPMRALPIEEARRIYKARYAAPVHFDEDPAGLDYTLFDYAVNSGVGRANKVARRVCGLADNAAWPLLSMALDKRDPKAVIAAVNAERLKFLQGLKTWPVFGKGWGPRVQSVNAASLHMATVGAPLPSTLPPVPLSADEVPQGKGEVPKPKTAGPVVAGGTGGGAATGHVAWFGDWIMAHPFISLAILVAGIAALLFIAE
jgi:lysozyme family protein